MDTTIAFGLALWFTFGWLDISIENIVDKKNTWNRFVLAMLAVFCWTWLFHLKT